MKKLYFSLALIFLITSLQSQAFNPLGKFVPSDRHEAHLFGSSVDVYGNFAVVSAINDGYDENGENYLEDAGSAYIFELVNEEWVEVQKLIPSDRHEEDKFGCSVSIFEDKVLVGAYHNDFDENGENFIDGSGAAFLFERNNNGEWIQTKKLTALERDIGDAFGHQVDIYDDEIAIVSLLYNFEQGYSGTLYFGGVYIFEDSSDVWIQRDIVIAANAGNATNFGNSIDLNNEHMIVGAIFENEDEEDENWMWRPGAAYIFKKENGKWEGMQKIVASDRQEEDGFGVSVSLYDDFCIVGSHTHDYDENSENELKNSGAAYIFRLIQGEWQEYKKLISPIRNEYDVFGRSVKINDGIVLISSSDDLDENGENYLNSAGAVYVYTNDPNTGSFYYYSKLIDPYRYEGEGFGSSIGFDGQSLLIGATGDKEDMNEENSIQGAGAVHYFVNNPLMVKPVENEVMEIYPNPSEGTFTLKLNNLNHQCLIEIHDTNGNLIYFSIIESGHINETYSLNNELKSGLYFVSVTDESGSKITSRLVMLKN